MDINQHITKLETQINALTAKQAVLHEQLAHAQVDQWQSRIDDLEVQVHLYAMETNERLSPLVEQLRNRWIEARVQLESTTTTAASAAETLRTGVENAYHELRKALLETKSIVSA